MERIPRRESVVEHRECRWSEEFSIVRRELLRDVDDERSKASPAEERRSRHWLFSRVERWSTKHVDDPIVSWSTCRCPTSFDLVRWSRLVEHRNSLPPENNCNEDSSSSTEDSSSFSDLMSKELSLTSSRNLSRASSVTNSDFLNGSDRFTKVRKQSLYSTGIVIKTESEFVCWMTNRTGRSSLTNSAWRVRIRSAWGSIKCSMFLTWLFVTPDESKTKSINQEDEDREKRNTDRSLVCIRRVSWSVLDWSRRRSMFDCVVSFDGNTPSDIRHRLREDLCRMSSKVEYFPRRAIDAYSQSTDLTVVLVHSSSHQHPNLRHRCRSATNISSVVETGIPLSLDRRRNFDGEKEKCHSEPFDWDWSPACEEDQNEDSISNYFDRLERSTITMERISSCRIWPSLIFTELRRRVGGGETPSSSSSALFPFNGRRDLTGPLGLVAFSEGFPCCWWIWKSTAERIFDWLDVGMIENQRSIYNRVEERMSHPTDSFSICLRKKLHRREMKDVADQQTLFSWRGGEKKTRKREKP